MPDFTRYRIRSHVDGSPVQDFNDILDFEKWGDRLTVTLDSPNTEVAARLFIAAGTPRPPRWAGFLQQGFGDEVQVPSVVAPAALLAVRIRYGSEDAYFAFTFGSGRYLLRDDAYIRNFGLRVALNALFEGDRGEAEFDPLRLRSVQSRRISANTIRQQGQANRASSLEEFEVDITRDLLSGVTGRPVDEDKWGTRLTGSNALHVGVDAHFEDLPALCVQMLKAEASTDYKTRFSWIDHVGRVDDPVLLAELENHIVDHLHAEFVSNLELVVPEIVEWPRLRRFRYPYERRPSVQRSELRLEDYIRVLKRHGLLEELAAPLLRRHRIDGLDENGDVAYSWSVWKCLSGEFEYRGSAYVLDDGQFFQVSRDYLAELDDFVVKHVPECDVHLPPARKGWHEDQYNAEAAGTETGLLLMDKRTIRFAQLTTPVELCDLLSVHQHLIHVKRNLGSSNLSHLFAQGRVSADLLFTSEQFRTDARAKVKEVVAERALDGGDQFLFFDSAPLDPRGFQIVYAVVADWGEDSFHVRLPFFSKVNLRRQSQELRRTGFRVSHIRIQSALP